MFHRRIATALLAIVALTGAATAQQGKSATIPCEAVASIGTAQMSADGVITLHLRSLWPDPSADSDIRYAPGDPQYDEIKQHLGGIAPGESKQVPPWC
jgi:hypothetical protein